MIVLVLKHWKEASPRPFLNIPQYTHNPGHEDPREDSKNKGFFLFS